MDNWLLFLANQTYVHPLLDGLMIGASTLGLALLPGLGAVLLASPTRRHTGKAMLLAAGLALLAALLFQFLAQRPRPEGMRLLLAAPGFGSFPSGHAAVAFGAAVALALSVRRWQVGVPAITLAALVAYSRLYLGHHYPTDVVAGALLGASLGAAGYGLAEQPRRDWRWLLWPQIGVAAIVSMMAYLGLLPFNLLSWPLADKVLHFLLFGAIVFWLNLWWHDRAVIVGGRALPLAIVVPLSLALAEEGLQHFSPIRSMDVTDLLSDLAGMVFFWWLSLRVIRAQNQRAGIRS
ncbi:MAG: hypothetical protein Kow0031_34840 [Anaerolineae bacterium]